MSLFIREFECPSCGGTVQKKDPASKSITCPYCGQTSHINADSLDAVGDKHLLIDYGSDLEIGRTYKIKERSFTVMGRVRMDYSDGFWDEWYVQMDNGKEGWIQEDDGSFIFFALHKKGADLGLEYKNFFVGATQEIGDVDMFVTSKLKGRIVGGEGELPFQIVRNEAFHSVEGIHKGKVVSAEIYPSEQRIYIGRELNFYALEKQ